MKKNFSYLVFCLFAFLNSSALCKEASEESDILPKLTAGVMATMNLQEIGVPAAYKALSRLLRDSNSDVRDDTLLRIADMRCSEGAALYRELSTLIFKFLLKEKKTICKEDNVSIFYQALLHTARCSLGRTEYLKWEKNEILAGVERRIKSDKINQQLVAIEVIAVLSPEAIQEFNQALIRRLIESKNPQVQKSIISALYQILWSTHVPLFADKIGKNISDYDKKIFPSNREVWMDFRERLTVYLDKTKRQN